MIKLYNPFNFKFNKQLSKQEEINNKKKKVEDTFNRELYIISGIENKMIFILIITGLVGYYSLWNASDFYFHTLVSGTILSIIYGTIYYWTTNHLGVQGVVDITKKRNIYYTPINALLTNGIVKKIFFLLVLFLIGEDYNSNQFYMGYASNYLAHLTAFILIFLTIQIDYHFNHKNKYNKLFKMWDEAVLEEQKLLQAQECNLLGDTETKYIKEDDIVIPPPIKDLKNKKNKTKEEDNNIISIDKIRKINNKDNKNIRRRFRD
ncbi:hypothetical protein [Dethiothermospora halolimnae]|uniref:hypothetical protein n=1 Tax=Dethiothermospora halolimnae TaxID=3114390 RepID=UPI003CCC3737